MLCNEKYKSSKSPVKVIEWEEIICRVGMRCSRYPDNFIPNNLFIRLLGMVV